jgi:hypothetical protein
MQIFRGKVETIGVNNFVEVPNVVIQQLLKQSGRNKGPIPVLGLIDGKSFTQNVVMFKGLWRLFLNSSITSGLPITVGDTISMAIGYHQKE